MKYKIGTLSVLVIFTLCFFYIKTYSEQNCDQEYRLRQIRMMDDLQQFAEPRACEGEYLARLHILYQIKVHKADIRIPQTFETKVLSWLGGDKSLLHKAHDQTIIEIKDRFTGEVSVYNPLRALRPNSQASDPLDYLNLLISDSSESCDFCNPQEHTAEETWGRIRTASSVSAANMFPLMGPYNGIIIPKQHSILQLSFADVADMFECARGWFARVNQDDPQLIYPMLVVDHFPKSGASQIHPHSQVWLGTQYTGKHLITYNAAKKYRSEFGGDYWEDMVALHVRLGIGFKTGDVNVIAPLTSKRDHEVLILGASVDSQFINVFYTAIKTFQEMGLYCISIGMSWPPLDGAAYPAMARISPRGDCSSVHSDISSIDLYNFNLISSNPTQIIQTLQKKFDKNL